jgi:hypothetical protein
MDKDINKDTKLKQTFGVTVNENIFGNMENKSYKKYIIILCILVLLLFVINAIIIILFCKMEKKDKIQTGTYFVRFTNGGHYMNTGKGERTYEERIYFEEKYEKIPHVMTSISGLDEDNKDSSAIRIELKEEKIDTAGFNLIIRTWDDSRLFNIKVTWTAFGQ